MLPSSQSAYHQFHNTETAVLKVYNDLLLAADSGQVSGLRLLDLMAAFNTVDHDHGRQSGLRCVVLQWFSSYLSDRSFRVSLVSVVSFSSGLVHICLTGPLELFLAATVHLWSSGLVHICLTGPLELFLAATVCLRFTCFAVYHKVQF